MRHTNRKAYLALLIGFLTICFSGIDARAQSAGDACSPTKFTSPIWVASGTGGGGSYLVCNGSNWVNLYSTNANGAMVLGQATGVSCAPATEGAIRYNTTTNNIELCDGSSWDAVSVGACGDATPDSINFTDLVNQSTSTLVTSNILQVTGLACTVGVSISGEGSPQFRTCSDSGCSTVINDWSSSSGTIANNSYIQLRLTTSAAGGDTYSATVSAGTFAEVWNATPTGDCSGSPAVGTVCADGTVYAGMSPDGNVKMYVTHCDAGMSWDGASCTGTRSLLPWNAGSTSGYVVTSQSSSVTGETNTTNIAPLDADSITVGQQDHVAAVYCNNLVQDGNSDWYLPATNELNMMYANEDAIGYFETSGTYYWSSTEGCNSACIYAGARRFSDGYNLWYASRFSNYAVRCARR